MPGLRRFAVLLAATAFVPAGCGDGSDVRVYRAPKDAPEAQAPEPAAPEAVEADPGAALLRWEAPPGWKELPGSGMRLATFQVPGGCELSVVALPGPAGGLLANINRWRGQIGLEPVDDAGLVKLSSRLRSGAGQVTVVDFAGPGAGAPRVLGGVLEYGGKSWFFKLTGPGPAAGEAKPAFLEFLKGLRPA